MLLAIFMVCIVLPDKLFGISSADETADERVASDADADEPDDKSAQLATGAYEVKWGEEYKLNGIGTSFEFLLNAPTYNGKGVGLCMEAYKHAPGKTTDMGDIHKIENEMVRKALYYSYLGPGYGKWSGWNDWEHRLQVVTMSCVLDRLYRNKDEFAVKFSGEGVLKKAGAYIEWLDGCEVPDSVSGVKFALTEGGKSYSLSFDTEAEYSTADKLQKTKKYKMSGGGAVVKFPSDVKLYVSSSGGTFKKCASGAFVEAGSTMYFTAAAAKTGNSQVKFIGKTGCDMYYLDIGDADYQNIGFVGSEYHMELVVSLNWNPPRYTYLTLQKSGGAFVAEYDGYKLAGTNDERLSIENGKRAGVTFRVESAAGQKVGTFICSYDGKCYADKSGNILVFASASDKYNYKLEKGLDSVYLKKLRVPAGTYTVIEKAHAYYYDGASVKDSGISIRDSFNINIQKPVTVTTTKADETVVYNAKLVKTIAAVDGGIFGCFSMTKRALDKDGTYPYKEGAVYTMYDESGTDIAEFTTAASGYAISCVTENGLEKYPTLNTVTADGRTSDAGCLLVGIPVGSYTVKETLAPDSCEPESPEHSATLSITARGETLTYWKAEWGQEGEVEWTEKTLKDTTLLTAGTGSLAKRLLKMYPCSGIYGEELKAFRYTAVDIPIQICERGEITFSKSLLTDEGTLEPMKNVVFRITSDDTGEIHYVVTDDEGVFSSEAAKKCGAEYLNRNCEMYTETDDGYSEETVNSTWGVWFCGDGDTACEDIDRDNIDITQGSLPYGSYTVAEVRCDANRGCILSEPQSFTIDSDSENIVIDAPFVNVPYPVLETLSDDHVAEADEAVLRDEVRLSMLRNGGSYTVKGIVMDKKTGRPAVDGRGDYITANKTFVAEGESSVSGYVTGFELCGVDAVTFTFCSRGMDSSYVVFEYLYEGEDSECIAVENGAPVLGDVMTDENGIPIAHADIENRDGAQTFDVPREPDEPGEPEITTTLDFGSGGETQSGEIYLTDTVRYTGLEPDTEYELRAFLCNKTTGNLIEKDGVVYCVSQAFCTQESTSGEVLVEMSFQPESVGIIHGDGTSDDIVCYEYLYLGGELIASHEDISSAEQTVAFPDIITSASANGGKALMAGMTNEVVDTIKYDSLDSREKYRITAKLIRKSDREIVASKTSEFAPYSEADRYVSGETSMSISIDVPKDGNGCEEYVVYEYIYTEDGTLVSKHEDINYTDQTVTLNYSPQTGDVSQILLAAIISGCAAAAAVITVCTKRRRKK